MGKGFGPLVDFQIRNGRKRELAGYKCREWVRDSDQWSIFKEEMDENVNSRDTSVEWVRDGR